MRTPTQPAAVADRRAGRPDPLVDTAWLADHLEDPLVQVVEVDVSPAAFAAGHIRGAVLWDIYADLKDVDYRLIDRRAVEQLVSRSGITADSTVVFYGYGPALGFWLMELYGHHDSRLLDASRETWQAEHRPWTDRVTSPATTDYPLPEPDGSIRVTAEQVAGVIDEPGCMVLDVRSDPEFRGERFWPSGGLEEGGRAGHVPGAVHLVADDVRDPRGAFLSTDRLAELYAPVERSREVLPYCTIGGRAATTWFVLTYLLGYPNVRLYDGSWAEWGRMPAMPVADERSVPIPTGGAA